VKTERGLVDEDTQEFNPFPEGDEDDRGEDSGREEGGEGGTAGEELRQKV